MKRRELFLFPVAAYLAIGRDPLWAAWSGVALQDTASVVYLEWDSAGASQRLVDENGGMWTFTASGVSIGVLRLLPDGSPATPSPIYLVNGNPILSPPSARSTLTVATAAYLISGQSDVFPATDDHFKGAVRWWGWKVKDGTVDQVDAVSGWAYSSESFSLVTTNVPPTQGTFTIYGGCVSCPRAPLAPGVLTFRG